MTATILYLIRPRPLRLVRPPDEERAITLIRLHRLDQEPIELADPTSPASDYTGTPSWQYTDNFEPPGAA